MVQLLHQAVLSQIVRRVLAALESVYGYFLFYYSYRPLSRALPRWVADADHLHRLRLFLHDLPAWVFARRPLPPGATIAFVLFAIGAIASDAARMDLSPWPVWARAALNAAYLAACIGIMLEMIHLVAR